MRTTETPLCKCLACGMAIDRASHPTDDDPPEEGDISICLKCGHLMMFTHDLRVRELTREEMNKVAADPEVLAVQHARARVVQ